MSLRLGMLQVARLAPNLLGEATDAVAGFFDEQLGPDGGALDRAGKSDLYYTAFALEGLVALRAELPVARVEPYLASFGAGAELDLVHRACLVRCWNSLSRDAIEPALAEGLLQGVREHKSADGGYGAKPGAEHGTLYNGFLALGAYQDLGRELPEPERLVQSIERLLCEDGGYADSFTMPMGTTPTTAAAAMLLTQLEQSVDPSIGRWLQARVHPGGGFLAVPGSPLPDLLSTATALHALSSLGVSIEPVREHCLDYLDTLWTGRAFCSHWEDDEVDCEYAFYALLALGHLSL